MLPGDETTLEAKHRARSAKGALFELLRKNILVARRNPIETAVFLLASCVLIAAVAIAQVAIHGPPELADSAAFELELITCAQTPCLPILYSPISSSAAQRIMGSLQTNNGLDTNHIMGFNSTEEMLFYAAQHYLSFSSAIEFADTVAGTAEYNLYGRSLSYWSENSTRPWHAVQAAINNAILAESGVSASAVTYQPLPAYVDSPYADFDLSSIALAPSLGIGCALAGMLTTFAIAREKQGKLLGVLRLLGLNDGLYWGSYVLSYAALSFIAAVIVISLGYATGITPMVRASWVAHLLAAFLLYVNMVAMGLAMGSLMTRPWVLNSAWLFTVAAAVTMSSIAMGVPSMYLADRDDSIVLSIVYFFMPWMKYGQFITIINLASAPSLDRDTFYAFGDMFSELQGGAIPTAFPALLSMFFSTVVFLFLAWYFGQVFHEAHGSARPSYFLLTPQFWGFSKKEAVVPGDTVAAAQEDSLKRACIRTHKLSKSYGSVVGLKELSIEFLPGNVTAVLGHNGAGKTSLINILTCLIPPTFGDAFVCGLSVRDDRADIQRLVGQCPQHDALWPDLTASEHLRLYAVLRGVPPARVLEDVAKAQEAFFLEDLMTLTAKEMSGGMRRRLSLSLATVGDPSILFLDEPTTGMDPVTRRKVWDAVRGLKRDRVVLLTTHSMSEAEGLGDSVAVMKQGQLRAHGPPLFLKNRFGSGYQLQITVDPEKSHLVQDRISKLKGAEILSRSAGAITVGLPRKCLHALPRLFQSIEKIRPRTSDGKVVPVVKEWSFSQSTMDEVFLKLCVAAEGTNMRDADRPGQEESECELCGRSAELITVTTEWGLKHSTPNLMCVSCAMSPVTAAALDEDGAANASFDDDDGGDSDEDDGASMTDIRRKDASALIVERENKSQPIESAELAKARIVQGYAAPEPTYSQRQSSQIRATFEKNFRLLLKGRKVIAVKVLIMLVAILLVLFAGNDRALPNVCPQGYEAGQVPCDPQALAMILMSGYRDHLSKGPVPRWSYIGTSDVWYSDPPSAAATPLKDYAYGVPPNLTLEEHADVVSYAREKIQEYTSALVDMPSACPSYYDQAYVVHDKSQEEAIAILHGFFPQIGLAVSAADVAGDRPALAYTVLYPSLATSAPLVSLSSGTCSVYNVMYDTFIDQDGGVALLSHAVAASFLRAATNTSSPYSAIVANVTVVPAVSTPTASPGFSTVVAALAVPLLALLNWPSYVWRMSYERQNKLVDMMLLSGLFPINYYVASCAFDLALALFFNYLVLVMGAVFGVFYMTGWMGAYMLAILTLAAVVFMGLGICVAAISPSESAARVFSLGILVATLGLAPVSVFVELSPAWCMIPPIGFSRCIAVVAMTGTLEPRAPVHEMLFFLLGGVILIFLGVILVAVPFVYHAGIRRKMPPLDEARALLSLRGRAAVEVQDLVKVYGKDKRAVDGLNLSIEDGECFGLLGPNGSGKSTTLSILCGLVVETSGRAAVYGRSVADDLRAVRGMMGVCPQFDTVWGDLTVKEHLTFFAGVRCVPRKYQRAMVQQIAEMVALDGDAFHQPASELSGGTLRRLSVAISLIGNPKVWVLDEPSTGLSPEARHMVWDIVSAQRQLGRTTIITTHSMEEADTLCSKIGIVVNGRLRTLGSQVALKQQLGVGYRLTFNMAEETSPAQLAALLADVRDIAQASVTGPDVEKTGSGSTAVFTIGINDTAVFRIFDELERGHERLAAHGVLEWGLTQPSLEEVFIDTVKTSAAADPAGAVNRTP